MKIFVRSIIFMLSLLISSSLYAVSFVRENNDLFLIAPSCSDFESTISSIQSWAAILDNSGCTVEILDQQGMDCKARVSGCLPEKVEKVLGQSPSKGGPNCHNFAFVSAGITHSIRHANPIEAMGVYSSHLCEMLKPDQLPQPGDIGRIDNSSGGVIHSFVFLTDNHILSKNGEGVSEFNLFATESVLTGYQVPDSKDCKDTHFRKSPLCQGGAEYYRCSSFEQYIKEKRVAPEYLNVLGRLNKFEEIAEERSFGNPVQSYEAGKLVSDSLILLNKYLDNKDHKLILNRDSSVDELFLLKNLMNRLDSLGNQFSNFDPGLGSINDFSENNIDKQTGHQNSGVLSGRWKSGVQSKIRLLESENNPSPYRFF